MKKIIFLVISLWLFTGCYDYKDVDGLDIVNGIYVDYKDDKYVLNMEIVSGDKESTEVNSKFIYGESKEISEAFNNIISNSSKELYLGNISILALSKDVTSMGIMDVLQLFIRDVSINNNYVVVVSEDIDELIKMECKGESLSNVILSTLKNSYDNTSDFMVEKVSSMIVNKTRSVSVPYIFLDDNGINSNYMAYFKGDISINKVSNDVYKLFNSKRINYLISTKDLDVTIYSSKIRYKVNKDGIKVIISGKCKINRIDNYSLEDINSYDYLENIINDKLKKDVELYVSLDSNLVSLNYIYYAKYGINYNEKYEVISDIKINKNGSIIGDFNE